MRYQLHNLTIGDEALCPHYGGSFSGYRIHACKDRCHKEAVRYTGSLPKDHYEYLTARRGTDLYLNMIDPPLPLFSVPLFTAALDFLDEAQRVGLPVAIHCNQGKSRAPSLAITYLAKRAGTLSDTSWDDAVMEFVKHIDPQDFQPGKGIETFLRERWGEIR